MAHPIGGTKRSSQLIFRRRLLVARLLLRNPASASTLMAQVQAVMGSEGYPESAHSALKHDLDALKSEYQCRINFVRQSGCYVMSDPGLLASLEMSDAALESLAALQQQFPAGTAVPAQTDVRDLLERVTRMLPPNRRKHMQDLVNDPRSQNPPPGRIDTTVLSSLRGAIAERREVVFRYWGTGDQGQPRRYRVAPYAIFFRNDGASYLDATLLEVSPMINETLLGAVDYRLDRIVPGTVQLLDTLLPEVRQHPPVYELRYRLLPVIARHRDFSLYFPGSFVQHHEDGSATVTARITDLHQAQQVLLRYGDACTVIGPPELVALMEHTARTMQQLYSL